MLLKAFSYSLVGAFNINSISVEGKSLLYSIQPTVGQPNVCYILSTRWQQKHSSLHVQLHLCYSQRHLTFATVSKTLTVATCYIQYVEETMIWSNFLVPFYNFYLFSNARLSSFTQ